MNNLEQTVRSRFPDLVLLGCLLGFAGIWYELYGIGHFREGSQVIGYASTIIGIVAAALGFVRAPAVRTLALVVLALLAVAGLYGLNEHRETRAKDYARWQARQSQSITPTTQAAAPAGTDSEGGAARPANRPFRSNIPTLAPASLSGLSALAFLAILARRRPGETP